METLAREYLLEVKVRLLEQLSLGFNSPQLAISFIEMLLDEYFTLADALPYLHQLLQPLVSGCVYVGGCVCLFVCLSVCSTCAHEYVCVVRVSVCLCLLSVCLSVCMSLKCINNTLHIT